MLMKTIVCLYTFLILSFMAQSQIKFYEGNFKTPISDLSSLDYSSEKGIGISIPINSTFKKYDRVYITFQYRPKESRDKWKEDEWMSCNTANQYRFEPKGANFADNYGGKHYIKLYLTKNDNFTDLQHIFYGGWIREYFQEYKFRIIVSGYFEDGTVTEWDNSSESFQTRTTYAFSKIFTTSPDLLFDVDNAYLNEKADKKKKEDEEKYTRAMNNAASVMTSEDLYHPNMSYDRTDALKSIKRSLSEAAKYTHIDSSGFYANEDFDGIKSRFSSIQSKYDIPFVPTRNHTLEAYMIARGYYMDKIDFKGLKELEEKLLQIKADKKHKTLKEKLTDLEDPEKIIQIIMEH